MPALSWIIVNHSWHRAFGVLWMIFGREGTLVDQPANAAEGVVERVPYDGSRSALRSESLIAHPRQAPYDLLHRTGASVAREQRKLAAIVAADIVGYSRLMGRDESGTLALLRKNRTERLDPVLAKYGGRLVKLTGDGALIEFASAVDALSAAIEFQQTMADANRFQPPDMALVFRLGVHLGDLIVEGDDLYGDGVNVAARLEANAPAGGILISRTVHEAVAGRLNATFDDLGSLELKNIERRVQAYSVKWREEDWQPSPAAAAVAAATAEPRAPLPLPEKPSIAVLPFQNMSGDPEQEYFADGVVEDIITALSHFPRLFVIARNSTFTYKGRAVDARQVGRELGVRYVLEGSVRRAGRRLRITGQLIEAESGAHLWADRCDGVPEDIFEFQDHVTESVVGAIAPRVVAAEVERAKRKRPENLDAYDLYLRALPLIRDMTPEGNNTAIELVNRALDLDPDYAAAAGLGAWAYTLRIAQNWRTEPEEERRRGVYLGRTAIARGENDADALAMGGYAIAFLGEELHQGLAAIERAIDLNPNGAVALAHAGWVRSYLGRADAAIQDFKESIRLSPREPMLFRAQSGLCFSYLLKRDFEQAVEWGQRALQHNPNFTPTHRALASALGHLGRTEEGRIIIGRLLELTPGLTITAFSNVTLYRYSGQLDLINDGLRKSGLPE